MPSDHLRCLDPSGFEDRRHDIDDVVELGADASAVLPARLFAPTPKAAWRVLEFFTTQINNDHTRKSYLNATRRFAEWCEPHCLHQLTPVP